MVDVETCCMWSWSNIAKCAGQRNWFESKNTNVRNFLEFLGLLVSWWALNGAPYCFSLIHLRADRGASCESQLAKRALGWQSSIKTIISKPISHPLLNLWKEFNFLCNYIVKCHTLDEKRLIAFDKILCIFVWLFGHPFNAVISFQSNVLHIIQNYCNFAEEILFNYFLSS